LKHTFKKAVCTLPLLLLLLSCAAQETIHISGIVLERDSSTAIPFAYILNRVSSKGMVANEEGRFEIDVRLNDSLLFSYLGYIPAHIRVSDYAHKIEKNRLSVKIILQPKSVVLNEITIRSGEFTTSEKKYYENILRSVPQASIGSPITALYYEFSKEGKSLKKLKELYDNLLMEEAVAKKLSVENLRKITGDKNIDLATFREYCHFSDMFILSASEYELFEAVSRCYKEHTEYYIKK
jgi:hypothetical protein